MGDVDFKGKGWPSKGLRPSSYRGNWIIRINGRGYSDLSLIEYLGRLKAYE